MVFIAIFMSLLLIGVTLWLWRLSQAQIIHFAVLMTGADIIVDRSLVDRSLLQLLGVLVRSLVPPSASREVKMSPVETPPLVGTFVPLPPGWEYPLFSTDDSTDALVPIVPPSLLLTARYNGWVELPKKIYEGDSRNISLSLDRESFAQGLHPETLNIQNTAAGKRFTLDLQKEDNREQFLEVELLAAALSIDGEKKQKQSLTLDHLAYHWNCQFKSAGEHEICLVLNVISPSGERNLGRIEQTIQVVKFDHATQHQDTDRYDCLHILKVSIAIKL